MTSPTPATPPVQPKKVKRSKTNGPVVTLPKAKFQTSVAEYELLDEAAREKKEEMAQKTAEEEAKKKCPETNTKPDIFQSKPFLEDDKIIIVKYPKYNKKEKDINDALNALNGTRKEGSTQDMPQAAIEALQRMFGKAPEQKTRGSNYGKLAQDFTFPPRPQSTAGKSITKEEDAASSSKTNEDAQEVDIDEFEKKERARRRKSNLNALAPEFTPSFAPGSSSADANKSVDSDPRMEVEDRKKKNKKEKAVLDMNGEIESINNQRKPRKRPSQQILTSELSTSLDSSTGSYGAYPNTYEHPPGYYVPAPPTPYPVSYVENNSSPNWDEFQKNLSTEVVSRVEVEVQKRIEKLVSEVKATLAETRPEYVGSSSSVPDKKNDDAEKRREEDEESRLQNIQEQLLQELQNHQQDLRSSHNEITLRHEEMQTRHLELQADLERSKDEVQSASIVQQRHAELQKMHQNLQENHNELQKEISQFDELKSRIQEILSEHRKIQDRQQNLHDEMTHSQTLQHRLNGVESDLTQARLKHAQLTSDNTRLINENAKLSEENNSYKLKLCQQDSKTSELTNRERQLQAEINTYKSNFSRNESELRNQIKTLETQKLSLEGNVRTMQNEHHRLYEENNVLIQERDRWRQTENDFKIKLRQTEADLSESRIKCRDIERILADKENTERQLNELRTHYNQLETEVSHGRTLKEYQEKLESDLNELRQKNIDLQAQVEAQLNQEKSKNHEIENLNRDIAMLRQDNDNIYNEFQTNHNEIRLNLEKKIEDLEHSLNAKDAEDMELINLRQRVREIDSIQKMAQELEKKFDAKQKMAQELEKKVDAKDVEVTQRNIELDSLRETNQKLQNELFAIHAELSDSTTTNQKLQNELFAVRAELSDSKTRLREEAEKSKIIADTRLQMTNLPTNSYSFPLHNPRTISDYNLDERRYSRDNMVYNSPSVSNNFDQSNYNNPIKSPNVSYPRQTFNQAPSNNNMISQNSQSMPITTSSVNLQHPQVHHSSMQHQPPIQHNQSQSALPLPIPPPMTPVVKMPYNQYQQQPAQAPSQLATQMPQQIQTHSQQLAQAPPQLATQMPQQIQTHSQQLAQAPSQLATQMPQQIQTHSQQFAQAPSQLATQMPQQIQTHSQLPPNISLLIPQQSQLQQTNTSALPSPTTSQQGSQSHSVQQQNAKENKGGHSRNSSYNSRNFGSNIKHNKNKKKFNNDRKNSSGENRNQNNHFDNAANNSKTNAPDSNDTPTPGNAWNKKPDELNTNSWW